MLGIFLSMLPVLAALLSTLTVLLAVRQISVGIRLSCPCDTSVQRVTLAGRMTQWHPPDWWCYGTTRRGSPGRPAAGLDRRSIRAVDHRC